jgi:hypothetical protein
MTTQITGWSWGDGSRDAAGHRNYDLHVVVQGSRLDGAANVMQTPGLPLPYSQWYVADDIDLWAWCKWEMEIKPRLPAEPNTVFDVTMHFTTKPPTAFCRTQQVEDPLLEPPKVSGDSTNYTEEAAVDYYGQPIVTSSWENITGAVCEVEKSRATVVVEMPFATANRALVDALLNTVNESPMWGYPARSVKFSKRSYKKMYQGSCLPYFVYTFTFEIRTSIDPDTGLTVSDWDKTVPDVGTKVLRGQFDSNGNWILINNADGTPPDRYNPADFIAYQDRHGNPAKVNLNLGLPANVVIGAGSDEVQSIEYDQPPSAGTFRIAWDGNAEENTLSWAATADDAQAELETIPGLEGNVSVGGGPLPTSRLIVTFNNDLANAQQPLFTLFASDLTFDVSPQLANLEDYGQVLSFNEPFPSEGLFALQYGGVQLPGGEALPYNATAGDVTTYLNLFGGTWLDIVTGGPLPESPISITYNEPGDQLLTVTDSTCTAPANVVTITEVNQGSSPTAASGPGMLNFKYYGQSNLLLLGIPVNIDL